MEQDYIDEISVNVLTVPSFVEELSSVIQYADMTKNPEKYGFTKLEYYPNFYWEHDTLNINEAMHIREDLRKSLANHKFSRYGGSARGEFPMIKSLGLSTQNARVYMKTKFKSGSNLLDISNKEKRQIKDTVVSKIYSKINNYHTEILKRNA